MAEARATGALPRWRDRLKALDSCPWPGPRPLDAADGAHLLIGRDRDREAFLTEVDRFRLILLTGSSGVGKTSLLEVGLVPELRQEGGYTVALCRDWSGGAEADDPVAFLAGKVNRGLADGGHRTDHPEGAGLFWALDGDLPGKVVLVLDQFEELIRDAPELTDQLFKLLVELNHRTSIRVVISFRSEYINELRPLESKAKPFSISHIQLEPVPAACGLDIVQAGNRNAVAITDTAAQRVADAWSASYGMQTGQGRLDRFGRIGILHLQALLYALHGQADGDVIDDALLDGIDDGSGPSLFSRGMRASIDLKLQRCRAAAVEEGIDPYLVNGTNGFVARSVEHLSSVGYKLVRGVYSLWAAALEQQLNVLPGDHEDLLHAITATILRDSDQDLDLLDASREDLALLAPAAQGEREWSERVAWDPDDGVLSLDRHEVTSGPMLGLPPAAVLVEELRRYAFALEWLQRSSLIRISTPGQGAVVSLIHDGFGAALEHWSERAVDRPAFAIGAITAPRGGEFIWQVDGSPEPAHEELDGATRPAVLTNLRWKGAWVRASFRNVQFVNCDLRGAGFGDCTFTGVSFVNCLLDGAMFTNCLVIGRPRRLEEGWSEEPPQFVLDAPQDLLDGIARYRGTPTADRLLSPTPGFPAVPAATVPDQVQDWTTETGGLTFYGGRISSLVLRSNRFADEGVISFRQVAGSGVEIVEQSEGAFEVAGSRLRHLTVSAPFGAEPDAGVATVHLSFVGSALAQAWISDTVGGTLTADDCRLVQIWNGSSTMDAVARNSRHFDLVNVRLEDCPPVDPLGAPATLEEAEAESFRLVARGMDYARDAASRYHLSARDEG